MHIRKCAKGHHKYRDNTVLRKLRCYQVYGDCRYIDISEPLFPQHQCKEQAKQQIEK